METADIIEPWRCSGCGKLIYNTVWIDEKECPAPGAPPATYGGEALPRLCSMCVDMLDIIRTSTYFRRLHELKVSEVDRLRRNG